MIVLSYLMLCVHIAVFALDSPTIQARQAFLATSPNPSSVFRRQAGYGPEHGGCKAGKTCVEACGNNFEECEASTTLSLFCYNPKAGQTCCKDGNGKACDKSYYCAQDAKKATFCCPDALSPAACASSYGLPELTTSTPPAPQSPLTPSPSPGSNVTPNSIMSPDAGMPTPAAIPRNDTGKTNYTGPMFEGVAPRGVDDGYLMQLLTIVVMCSLGLYSFIL